MSEAFQIQRRRTLVFGCVLTLGGCGGGSGGSATPSAGNANGATGILASGSNEVLVATINTQMQPNSIYEVSGRPGASVITLALPTTPAVGDWLRIRCVSDLEWRIGQHADQTILTRNLAANKAPGAVWTAPKVSPGRWSCLASDAAGTVLAAGTSGDVLYLSRDGGTYWGVSNSVGQDWSAVAATPDGAILAAAGAKDRVWVSRNGGDLWAPVDIPNAGTADWQGLALAADGGLLAVAAFNGAVQVSDDTGLTWSARGPVNPWRDLAMTRDGTLLAAAAPGAGVFTSTDAGMTWSLHSDTGSWQRLALSADGDVMVAAESGVGRLALSRDAGQSWTEVRLGGATLRGDWTDVAVSAAGDTVLAARSDGDLLLSQDAGATFTAVGTTGVTPPWRAVALSNDGDALLAASGIDTATGTLRTSYGNHTTVGSLGGLTGGLGSAIALTYLGDGRFDVTASSGSFAVR